MHLCLAKVDWAESTMLFRVGPNLVAMILEMTLYITLQHAMGWKSLLCLLPWILELRLALND